MTFTQRFEFRPEYGFRITPPGEYVWVANLSIGGIPTPLYLVYALPDNQYEIFSVPSSITSGSTMVASR